MKKVIYGAVSAFALMLALPGVSMADGLGIDVKGPIALSLQVTGAGLDGPVGEERGVDQRGVVVIKDGAFAHAAGAIQVLNNQSDYSTVQQSQNIAASTSSGRR